MRPLLAPGDLKIALGYLGAAALFVGIFLPLVETPAGTNLNYFWTGCASTALLLALTAGSILAVATRRFWLLWLSGTSSLLWTGYALSRAVQGVGRQGVATAATVASAADGRLAGALERGFSAAVQLRWGWPVLFIGGLLLVASSEMARREGVLAPRLLWRTALAALMLATVVAIGPSVLSGTQKAFVEMQQIEKREARKRWEPHESAREEMVAALTLVRDEVDQERKRLQEEEQDAEARRTERARAKRVAQVRRVNEVRRWYSRFAESVRPVVDASRSLEGQVRGAGHSGAEPALRSVLSEVRKAAAVYPRSPDPDVNGTMARLFELCAVAAESGEDAARVALTAEEVERCDRELRVLLDELAVELASYCLQLPGGDPMAPAPGALAYAADCRNTSSGSPFVP